MLEQVDYARQGEAVVLTLNRPDRRNALSEKLVRALADAFRQAEQDDCRCVILTGAGPAFCAGLDLIALAEAASSLPDPRPRVHAIASHLASLFEQIQSCSKPTIAAVNGDALAGGAGLVSVCDLALAVPQARLGYPGVRRGLAAAVVIPPLMRLVRERVSRQLLLTADTISASTACSIGLINAVVPSEALLTEALAWSRRLAEGGPKALAATKSLLRQVPGGSVPVTDLADWDTEAWVSTEALAGLEAFARKQAPPWQTAAPPPEAREKSDEHRDSSPSSE